MTEFNFDTVFDETMQTHNLDTVVILGHLNPDGDAAGSVMSLAHYIHVNYPQYRVFPYLAKTLERGPKKMVVEDKIFVPFEMPDISGKQYCVIVCDNATLERMIGLEYYQNAAASIVVDHHASNEGYGDVNWTKVSEACAENVYHMLSSELLLNAAQKEAYPNAADYIYLGILHDTGGLARANQGIFQAVADLMAMGVDHGRIMKTFHAFGKLAEKSRRHILTNKTVISVLPSLFIIRQEPVIGRSAFELFAICTEHQIIDLIRSTGHLSGIFFPDPGSHYPHQESGLRTGTDQDFFFIGSQISVCPYNEGTQRKSQKIDRQVWVFPDNIFPC